MGMAASQARFLQLTARKTNVEYMGQQINQQRLALANASAGLFEKMLSMVSPTPPSSQDDKYFTQGYKFTDPADDIQKNISWTSATVLDTDFKNTSGVAIPTYTIKSTTGLTTLTMSNASMATAAGSQTLTNGLADALLGPAVAAAQRAAGDVTVIKNVTTQHTYYDPDGVMQTKTVTTPALLVFDNLNRLISFTSFNKASIDASATASATDDDNTVTAGGLVYSGTFDSVAYNNDMNKYEFEKSTYDYQIERINQETKIIQTQDKSLELKMKQLDTEHNALSTEMDAVQKVLQKNIEGSFKTFA